MRKKRSRWDVLEVKVKESVITDKEYLSVLADVWQLLVEKDCQPEKKFSESYPRNEIKVVDASDAAPDKRRAS